MSYILKVQPMLDESKTRKMESTLVKRFQRVSRTFGRGLKNAFKFGLMGGAVSGTLAAILQPLRDADEKLNSVLAKADNVGTRAKQFGTTAADYLAFQAAASAKGLNEEQIVQWLTRMQSLIGEAKAGGTSAGAKALRSYKNETDMLKVFFNVANALRNMDNTARIKFESDIFGQRAAGKLEEFITSDIEALSRSITKGISRDAANRESTRLGALEDEQGLLRAMREFEDFFDAGNNITAETVRSQNQNEVNKNDMVNKKLTNYEMYAKIQNTVDKLLIAVTNITTPLFQVITPLVDLISWGASYLPPLIKKLDTFISETVPVFFNKFKGGKLRNLLEFIGK